MRHVQPALLELAARPAGTGAGNASLVVRLDPPELGPVLVRVVLRDGAVSVSCRSADAGAVGVLQRSTATCMDALRREGFAWPTSTCARTAGDRPGGEPPPRATPVARRDAGSARRERRAGRQDPADRGTGATAAPDRPCARDTPARRPSPDSTWL